MSSAREARAPDRIQLLGNLQLEKYGRYEDGSELFASYEFTPAVSEKHWGTIFDIYAIRSVQN